MSHRRFQLCAALALALSGCGQEPSSATGADADEDAADLSDTEPTDLGVIRTDADPETTPDADAAELLGLGDECDRDGECESDLCIDLVAGTGGGLCSQYCVDDAGCPDEFDCVIDRSSGGDLRRICLPLDWCIDADEDGYGEGPGCQGTDCDDLDPTSWAGGNEVCDGRDNDCDGVIDDFPIDANQPCQTGFLGQCGAGRTSCSSGLLDCVALASPSAEICDGIDNDCDGELDEGLNRTAFFVDADHDGFGDPTSAVVRACANPPGYAGNRSDCDDTDPDVRPGVSERPGDGIDQDCDGRELCYADRDRDGVRTDEIVVSTNTRCDGPGQALASAPAGDCDDNDPSIRPGAPEIVGDGIDQDCNGAEACFEDRDRDGARTTARFDSFTMACLASQGRALASAPIDCDDTRADVGPGAPELCDGRDNDCDGAIDEGARCFALGAPCADGTDCASGLCEAGRCAEPAGCGGLGSCPSRLGLSSGGGRRTSETYTMELTIGSPVVATRARSERWSIALGLGAFRADP